MKAVKIALVGNPNCGKTSLFNSLTGLNQKISNYPGTTIDRKTGQFRTDHLHVTLIDLPGAYSLYPKAADEAITFETLTRKGNDLAPDLIIFVADASNLKRNLHYFSQVADLGIPMVLALNMLDIARKKGISINQELLSKQLGVAIVPINARKGKGIPELKHALDHLIQPTQKELIDLEGIAPWLSGLSAELGEANPYRAWLAANGHRKYPFFYLREAALNKIPADFDPVQAQAKESVQRYFAIDELLSESVQQQKIGSELRSNRIDKILTHRFWGVLIFLGVLFVLFQLIFLLAEWPMAGIEWLFSASGDLVQQILPKGQLADLIVNGILAGLGGVLVFLPQIALLIGFIAILEDTGYMARVSFMMDKLMRKVGLNGKSVVPLFSGVACAVPAILATRSIEHPKDRLITIMITPLMSCSARLPVYTLLIGILVEPESRWGFLNIQGLLLMGMYLLGFVGALAAAWVFKKILRQGEKNYFIMELPVYRAPRWKNLWLTIWQKSADFVTGAGKVIIAVSIVLWFLASFGPGDRMQEISNRYEQAIKTTSSADEQLALQAQSQAEQLEHSYAGILGKWMEPAIRPLGYDWRIGIALISSLAAREVFVGTMSTIYSLGGDDSDLDSLRDRMSGKTSIGSSGNYTPAVAFSLMIFYAFAMQCISTLSVVYRETRSWKWPLIQLGYMTGAAYLLALIAYQLLR